MESLKQSDFTSVTSDAYTKLQQDWQVELSGVFESFKREMTLLKQKELEISIAEVSLQEREKKVKEREDTMTQSLTYIFSCRHTLRTFNEDVIGIGLSLTRGACRRVTRIEFIAEYLSATAYFDLGIRQSRDHELQYNGFLPLYINPDHASRAKNLLEGLFLSIVADVPQTASPKVQVEEQLCQVADQVRRKKQPKFHSDMAVMILGRLMNQALSYIVAEKFHPFKGLETYCLFHRLLLAVAAKYPAMIECCTRQLNEFVSSECLRAICEVPVLGEFLTLFTVSSFPWDRAVDGIVDQLLQRSWAGAIELHPELGRMVGDSVCGAGPVIFESVTDAELVTKAFSGMLSSARLVMLHYSFYTNVAHFDSLTLAQIADNYDSRAGHASPRVKEKLMGSFREIQAVSSFAEFFQFVGYTHVPISTEEIAVILKRTMSEAIVKQCVKV